MHSVVLRGSQKGWPPPLSTVIYWQSVCVTRLVRVKSVVRFSPPVWGGGWLGPPAPPYNTKKWGGGPSDGDPGPTPCFI